MLTMTDIEERNYTYCQVIYVKPSFTTHTFLVPTTSAPKAKLQAAEYARQRWGVPDKLYVYPRNYVAKARDLYHRGEVAS